MCVCVGVHTLTEVGIRSVPLAVAQLRKAGLRQPVPLFPAKRMLALSTAQVIERREGLETWFQKVGQEPEHSNSNEFREFLLNQQDEVKLCCEEVELTVRACVL